MDDGLLRVWVLDVVVLVDSGAQHDGHLKLLEPADVFLLEEVVDPLLLDLSSLHKLVIVRHNLDITDMLFA